MTPKMQIVWAVLEAAKDNGDEMFTKACRRIINADRLGWKAHGDQEDWKLVREMYESMREVA
jgi:hypothetical protein